MFNSIQIEEKSSREQKPCDGSAARFLVSALALTRRPSFEILRLWGHAKAQNSAGSVPANHRAFADDGIFNQIINFSTQNKTKQIQKYLVRNRLKNKNIRSKLNHRFSLY